MIKSSVIPVITLWEEFLQKDETADMPAFARWILKEKKGNGSLVTSKQKPPVKNAKRNADSELDESAKAMLLITRLHRFVQLRSKPVLKKIGFSKNHEYGVLIQVHLLKNPNKKEIADEMLLENTTTVEITNRLVERGFLKEINDPSDKRSTRLTLTAKGQQKLYESYEGMEKIHANFIDCLDDKEKKELVRLLEQVERFQTINDNVRSA